MDDEGLWWEGPGVIEEVEINKVDEGGWWISPQCDVQNCSVVAQNMVISKVTRSSDSLCGEINEL